MALRLVELVHEEQFLKGGTASEAPVEIGERNASGLCANVWVAPEAWWTEGLGVAVATNPTEAMHGFKRNANTSSWRSRVLHYRSEEDREEDPIATYILKTAHPAWA